MLMYYALVYRRIKSMRKTIKLISVMLILVTLLGLCSGCMKGETVTTLRFGVPWAEDSEVYQKMQEAVEENNLFTEETDFVRIELVPYASDEESKKAFLKDVGSDQVAFFFYERDELLDKYIEDGTLATLAEMRQVYPSIFESEKEFVMDNATDVDGVNHLLPFYGNYQGVFFNESLFLQNGLKIPKTWEQFTNCIETFKAKGITPIAGGFADGGMKYWMDELILMEGGVAEHSYVPKFGVVNSWTRAIKDFESLYKGAAFNSNCMSATQAEAVELFNSGKAAMILANSKEVATETADLDNLGVFALPVTNTGKKNIGDIICDFDNGIYINAQWLKKETVIIDTMIVFITEVLNKYVAEDWDTGELELPPYGYPLFKQTWSLPANPYSIELEPIIEDNEFVSPEEIEEVDPTLEVEIIESENLEARVFDMMETTTLAGRSLITEFHTFDDFIASVKNYIENGGDIEKILVDSTEKEVAAQNGTTDDAAAETTETTDAE